MNEMELLFSSDYYEEYKKDIYAVSSLPNGYYYRFRYPPEYTSDFLRSNHRKRINAKAIIIFVTGNSASAEKAELGFVPIRLAIIKKINIDEDTGMFHVHFELDDFIELQDSVEELDETPVNEIFFGHQVIQPSYRVTTWKDVVEKLFKYENALYFRVRVEDATGEELVPVPKDGMNSHFTITEMRDYFINFSIANLCSVKETQEIRSRISASDLSSTLSETIQPALEYDTRRFKLSGLEPGDKSTRINMVKLRSYSLDPKTGAEKSIYSIRLLFDVKKSTGRRLRYFGITLILLAGTSTLIKDFDDFGELSLPAKIFSLAGLLAASWATSELYSRFNKK